MAVVPVIEGLSSFCPGVLSCGHFVRGKRHDAPIFFPFEMAFLSALDAFNVQVVMDATTKYGQAPTGSPSRPVKLRRQVTAGLAWLCEYVARTGGFYQ